MEHKKLILILLCAALVVAFVGYDQFFKSDNFTDSMPLQGKLDINAVCEGVLAYMTFPDGASAETFVAECKEGKHPEVIERYKSDRGLGDGTAI